MVVFRAALAGTAPHGREGIYFGENGEYRHIDAARVYTEALHALGKSKTPEPTMFSQEEMDKYFGGVESRFTPLGDEILFVLMACGCRWTSWERTRARARCVDESWDGSRLRRTRISLRVSRGKSSISSKLHLRNSVPIRAMALQREKQRS